MTDFKKSNESKDYKERFEFKLTVGDIIICQRYFKVFNFNPTSLNSMELADTLRELARLIDLDLKDKTHVFMEMMCPQIFNTEDEMYEFFANPYNHRFMRGGHGIVVKSNTEHDYAWKHELDKDGNVLGGSVMPLTFKFDDGEFTKELTPEDYVEYKLSFIDNGPNMDNPKEICSTTWVGIYPRYVRNSIDLSNKRGRVDKTEIYTLGFESYMAYKIFGGRPDYIYKIIKELQTVCSNPDNSWYTVTDTYKLPNGKNKIYKYRVEVDNKN
jgi:hypothetical protein